MSAEVVVTPFDTASVPPLPQLPSKPGPHHIRLTSHASGQGGVHDGLAQSMAKSAVRTMGSTVGREIIRGVLGSLFGKKR